MNNNISLETINAIGDAHLSNELNAQFEESGFHAVALTKGISLESTERFLKNPPKFKAKFKTSTIEEFAAYSNDQKESTVFIDNDIMFAEAIFDIGEPNQPANRLHTAEIRLKRSADYQTLLSVNDTKKTQKELVAWLEEHHSLLKALGKEQEMGRGAPEIGLAKAIHAIRNINIKSKVEAGNKIDDFSESNSVLGSISVDNDNNAIPSYIDFTCVPFHSLILPEQVASQSEDTNMERTFRVRISLITTPENVTFSLKILQMEQHKEVMQAAFKTQLANELKDETTVRIGNFE